MNLGLESVTLFWNYTVFLPLMYLFYCSPSLIRENSLKYSLPAVGLIGNLNLTFRNEIFPHFVWEKNLTGIIRKIRSASPKSPSDFPNVSQIFWCGLPHQKTSDNSDVIINKKMPHYQITYSISSAKVLLVDARTNNNPVLSLEIIL